MKKISRTTLGSPATLALLLLTSALASVAACGDDAASAGSSSGTPGEDGGDPDGGGSDGTTGSDGAGGTDADATDGAHAQCPMFSAPAAAVTVAAAGLVEASGLVASSKNAGIFWAHNDSGDSARIFALNASGTSKATIPITGASAVDWEDIAWGAGPGGEAALFIGDIGDNAEARAFVTVYRVLEPDLSGAAPANLPGTAIELAYEDGKGHNAEALMIDPRDGAIVIVTKVASGKSGVYRAAPPFAAAGTKNMLKKEGSLTIGTAPSGSTLVTGASISRAGDLVFLRTYTHALAWTRGASQSIAAALAAPPCVLPVATEIQGEAIAYAPDGSGFYTLSEGSSPPLSFVAKK